MLAPKTQKCSSVVLRRGCGKRASSQEGRLHGLAAAGSGRMGKEVTKELAVRGVSIFILSRLNFFCFLDSTADERY